MMSAVKDIVIICARDFERPVATVMRELIMCVDRRKWLGRPASRDFYQTAEFPMSPDQITKRIVQLVIITLVCSGLVRAQQIKSAVPDVARPLPLSAVRLTGGPLKRAQDLDAEYLLK